MFVLCKLFVFVGLLAFVLAQRQITTKSCGGAVKSVTVVPCDVEPCIFKKGGQVRVHIDFLAENDADQLKINLRARVGGMDLPFPGMKTNACNGMGIQCPIAAGDRVSMVVDMDIRSHFPSIETEATFILTSPAGVEFCFQTPVTIKEVN